MRLDPQVRALSSTQHSCVAAWQLRQMGASRTEVSRLRRSGDWEDTCGPVLRLVGSAPTDLQRAMVAVLAAGPGAALSHASAAFLWELGTWYRLLPAHVFRAHAVADVDAATRPGRVHKLRGIDERWLTVVQDLPVVRPELCIYQLCGSVHPGRAERALDRAWSMGLVTAPSLRRCLLAFAKQGRNGTTVLRTLLDERGNDHVPPASGLEARFQAIAGAAGATGLRRQVDLGGDEGWAGRVDFLDDRLRLVVEVQSAAFHRALSYQRDDAARIRKLEAAGYTVLEIWDTDIWHDPSKVAHALVQARGAAAARHAASRTA